jgi:hypothetical protein
MLPPVGPNQAARKRTRDRFAEINGFIDFTLADLTRAAVAVWLILWRDTKPDGLARTGQADLGRRAGMSERSVRAAIDELIGAKVLKVVRRGGVRVGASTYRVRGVNPDRTG